MMARFRFGLQAVLDMREREERERRVVVARLEGERLELEGLLRGYQASMRSCKEAMRRALGAGDARMVDGAALRMEAGSALSMQTRAHQAALRLGGVHRRLASARRALMEATRARRAIEVLRERRLAAWEAEEKRREGAMLDEIGTMGAGRRGGVAVEGGAR